MKPLYTIVFRKSGSKWLALCLENGLVGQGESKEAAVGKLREAITSLDRVLAEDEAIYSSPISIRELHEFLTYDVEDPAQQRYELITVHGQDSGAQAA